MGRNLSLLSSLVLALGMSAVPHAASGGLLSDRDCKQTLTALEGSSAEVAHAAMDEVVVAGDQRFVELLWASEVGIAAPGVRAQAADALRRLTGESFGADWPAHPRTALYAPDRGEADDAAGQSQ